MLERFKHVVGRFFRVAEEVIRDVFWMIFSFLSVVAIMFLVFIIANCF